MSVLTGEAWITSPERRELEISKALKHVVPCTIAIAGLATAITIIDRVNPFFVQQRYGDFNSSPVPMRKLRTMRHEKSDTVSTGPKDPRRSWLGEKLSDAHVDELTEIYAVLRGQMSFVGPRGQVAAYRHDVFDLVLDRKLSLKEYQDWEKARAIARRPAVIDPFGLEAYSRGENVPDKVERVLAETKFVFEDASREMDEELIRGAYNLAKAKAKSMIFERVSDLTTREAS
jgi:hypothetical protein